MNEKLLHNINSIVKPEDTLYLIGDVSFYDKKRNVPIIQAINCPVVLIVGNHDHGNRRKGVPYQSIHSELNLILGAAETKRYEVTLCHYPYWIDNMLGHEISEGMNTVPDRFKDIRPIDKGLWLLHGHTHDKSRIRREHRMVHVGVDAWQYAPVSEIDIIKLIEEKDDVNKIEA